MTSPRWVQLCFRVPDEGATGAVVAGFLGRVVDSRKTPWVGLTDVDACGGVRQELVVASRAFRVLPTQEFLRRVASAEQVVWATAMFCPEKATADSLGVEDSYAALVSKAALTARVVDASYLYLFARSEAAKGWRDTFPEAAIKECDLDGLEFPE